MLIKPTKAGLSNAFTLYEGSKVVGTSKLVKLK